MENLVLVRHGATSWNENGYCQGHKDVRLSAVGKQQVGFLKSALEQWEFDAVYSSNLMRAQETARFMGYEPTVLRDLVEIDRGHWEGHEGPEIRRRWGKLHKQWYDDPAGLAMPGGESFDELWERAGDVIDRLQSDGHETVLVCAHKAINRVLIARMLDRPTKGVWQIPQPQAGLSELIRSGDGWIAETIGDVEHLPTGMRSES